MTLIGDKEPEDYRSLADRYNARAYRDVPRRRS